MDIINQKDDLAKYGVLFFDEMYIKQCLEFEKSTGALSGFTTLGDISNQLDEFVQSFKDHCESLPCPFAKSMPIFMKGLFNNISCSVSCLFNERGRHVSILVENHWSIRIDWVYHSWEIM